MKLSRVQMTRPPETRGRARGGEEGLGDQPEGPRTAQERKGRFTPAGASHAWTALASLLRLHHVVHSLLYTVCGSHTVESISPPKSRP